MQYFSSLSIFLVFSGLTAMIVLAAPPPPSGRTCPDKFVINATVPDSVDLHVINGQPYCAQAANGRNNCSPVRVEYSYDGDTDRMFISKDGGLFTVGQNPLRRMYIDVSDTYEQKRLYWKNTTDPVVFNDQPDRMLRPVTASMDPRTCVVKIEYKNFKFNGGVRSPRNYDFILSNATVPLTATTRWVTQFPISKLTALP